MSVKFDEEFNRLSQKQQNFFIALTDPKSDTLGEQLNSYLKAGYKNSPSAVYNASYVFNSPKFTKVMTLYRQNQLEKQGNRAISERERILSRIDAVEDSCWETDENGIKHCIDRSSALKSLELRGKAIALWIDKTESTYDTTGFILDEAIKQEALELARSRLMLGNTKEVDCTVVEEETSLNGQEEALNEESDPPHDPPRGAGVDTIYPLPMPNSDFGLQEVCCPDIGDTDEVY